MIQNTWCVLNLYLKKWACVCVWQKYLRTSIFKIYRILFATRIPEYDQIFTLIKSWAMDYISNEFQKIREYLYANDLKVSR